MSKLGKLDPCETNVELVISLDYQLIVFNIAKMDETIGNMVTSQEFTG